MKKILGFFGSVIIAFLVLLFAIALMLGSCAGLGPGNESGDGDDSGTNKGSTAGETIEANNEEATVTTETRQNKLAIAISVVENEYFYKNQKTEIEEFIALVSALEEDFVVEVTDDNASKKAYSRLIDALEENLIEYLEK